MHQPANFYEHMLRARRRTVAEALTPVAVTPAAAASEEDQAQALQHEAVSIGLNNLGYEQLRLIEEALDRLASGDYGTCFACESPIPPRRLEAVPWARYCVPCQEHLDEVSRTAIPALTESLPDL